MQGLPTLSAFLKEDWKWWQKKRTRRYLRSSIPRLSARFEEKTVYSRQRRWANSSNRLSFHFCWSLRYMPGYGWAASIGSFASNTRMVNLQLLNDFEAEPIESFLLK
jgi:hypothetical protein